MEVGEDVKGLSIGDEVYTRLPEANRGNTESRPSVDALVSRLTSLTGSWSEFAKCPERYVARKPKNLSFSDAASLPLAGVTALQVLGKYKGSLEGKTVFIPAGCKLYDRPI